MFLDYNSFKEKVHTLNTTYWNTSYECRWEYMSKIISILREYGCNKTIEAGCNGMLLNSDSYNFDLPKHDLNKTPYPFRDKEFDAFIATQVWEHISDQSKAFREALRISNLVILSFPYKWNNTDGIHGFIDESKIDSWTCSIKPIDKVIVGGVPNRKIIGDNQQRIIYWWKS